MNGWHGQIEERRTNPPHTIGECAKYKGEHGEDVLLNEAGEEADAEHDEEKRPKELKDGECVAGAVGY